MVCKQSFAINTCATPATLGAKTLSNGRDQGGRRSKTVDAASAEAREPAGVDRGRRLGALPRLRLASFLCGQRSGSGIMSVDSVIQAAVAVLAELKPRKCRSSMDPTW